MADDTPIIKTGLKYDANNYGPISVIIIVSRISEKIVHDCCDYYIISLYHCIVIIYVADAFAGFV